MAKLYLLLLVIVTLSTSSATFLSPAKKSAGLSPVIFIPGLATSQLEARFKKTEVVHWYCDKLKKDYFTIWLNFLEVSRVPLQIIDCFVDNAKLVYNNATRKTQNSPGVEFRVPGFGTTDTLEHLDETNLIPYFEVMAEAFVNIGYVRNVSLRGAPYDFRKAANELGDFFVQLKDLVEETYTINGNAKVTLLTHSMGGFMGQYFLKQQTQEWKDQYIKRFISLATPWGGAFEALESLVTSIDITYIIGIWSEIRTLVRTFPSLVWLMPSAEFWEPTEVLVQTPKFNYTINDLGKLFLDLKLPNVWEMRKDTEALNDLTAPGVELHCLYGTSLPTPERIIFEGNTWEDDGKPVEVYGNGDGFVNLRSLTACERSGFSTEENQGHPVTSTPFVTAMHFTMLYDVRIIAHVTGILSSD